DDAMDAMLRVRAAFDPSGLCNPGKIIPLPKGCGEARAVATQGPTNLNLSNIERKNSVRRNFVPQPAPRPKEQNQQRSTMDSGLAGRIIEAKVANELKRIVGGGNVTRLSETTLADTRLANIL